MALDRTSMGCVRILFALIGNDHSPGACATVARERYLHEKMRQASDRSFRDVHRIYSQ